MRQLSLILLMLMLPIGISMCAGPKPPVQQMGHNR